MLGALIGDVVGSTYEFNNVRTKDFPLFSAKSSFTDDSVLTLAVADCLQRNVTSPQEVSAIFKRWCRAYPAAGFGGRFRSWMWKEDSQPYGSYGNGAAMRVSPCGWYGQTAEEVKELSCAMTQVTHNSPEGLLGAEVVATCVFLARTGHSKQDICAYAQRHYNLNFDYEDLRQNYHFDETCQGTVPQALFCFLISTSFEDCLRTSISVGGDSDTLAAISCAVADAYYGTDETIFQQALQRMPPERNGCNALQIVQNFCRFKNSLACK